MELPSVENITTSDQLDCLSGNPNRTLTPNIWRFEYAVAAPEVLTVELLIYLTAFVCNLFIVVFMLVKRDRLKDPPNVFLFALGLTDLAATLLTSPFYLSTVVRGEWFFGEDDCTRQSVCKGVGFILSLILLYQTNIIAAMSFDRFLAIVKPLHYSRYLTWKRALLIVLGAFTFSLIPSITPLFGFGVFFFEGRLGACLFRWTGQTPYVIFFVFLLLIPIVLISVFTVITYWKIRSFLRHRFHHHTRRYSEGTALSSQQRKYNASQRNLLWLFTALLAILALCWSPGIITAVVSVIIGTNLVPGPVFLTALLFVLTNIAANPITQAIFIKDIRRVVTKVLRILFCFWCCCKKSGYSVEASTDVMERTKNMSQDSTVVCSTQDVHSVDTNLSNGFSDSTHQIAGRSSETMIVTFNNERVNATENSGEVRTEKRNKVSWSPETDEGFESETRI